ncbi:hypothetical protein D3C72_2241520 [compost metagenome]
MEGLYRVRGFRAEGQVEPGPRRAGVIAQLQAQLVLIIDQAVPDRGVVLEHAAIAQRAERGIVERAGHGQVANAQ